MTCSYRLVFTLQVSLLAGCSRPCENRPSHTALPFYSERQIKYRIMGLTGKHCPPLDHLFAGQFETGLLVLVLGVVYVSFVMATPTITCLHIIWLLLSIHHLLCLRVPYSSICNVYNKMRCPRPACRVPQCHVGAKSCQGTGMGGKVRRGAALIVIKARELGGRGSSRGSNSKGAGSSSKMEGSKGGCNSRWEGGSKGLMPSHNWHTWVSNLSSCLQVVFTMGFKEKPVTFSMT